MRHLLKGMRACFALLVEDWGPGEAKGLGETICVCSGSWTMGFTSDTAFGKAFTGSIFSFASFMLCYA